MRRVYHYCGLGDSRVIGHITQELLHLQPGIQHRVIHVDVNYACPVLDLSGGDLEPCFVVTRSNQFGELARPCHIGSFPDIGEIVPPVDSHAFQTTDIQHIVQFRNFSRGYSFNRFRHCLDVLRCRSAASSHDVHRACQSHFPHRFGHLGRRLVIFTHLIWQSGVRVAAHRTGGERGDLRYQRNHLLSSERAVEPERQRITMLDGAVERFHCLPCERAPALVTH